MIQIKHRFTDAVLFEFEAVDIRDCLLQALKSGANLSYANLSYADLSCANLIGANLRGANLRGADLRYADLSYANLSYADLSCADLSYANLSSADLSGADLRYADLSGADLRYADLSYADLRCANLRCANLSSANLAYYKTDFFDILLRAPKEIAGLREHLINGKVDGSCYQGECACLLGTIANVRHCDYKSIGNGLSPNSLRPAEQLFTSIKKGDTPENNIVSKIIVEWLDEFMILLELAKQ